MREFIAEKNQRIRIGRDIVITILKVCAGRVKYLLDAPKGTDVIREQGTVQQNRKRSLRNNSFRLIAQRLAGQPR